MSKKYRFIYITSNLLNEKKYIGSHSTNNLYDNYLGSGKNIKKEIKELGRNIFGRKSLNLYLPKKTPYPNYISHKKRSY